MGQLTFLDAYPIVAFLNGEPAADEVEEILRGREAAVSTVNLGEAVDIACRVQRVSETIVRSVLEPVIAADALRVVAPDENAAWRAAQLRVAHYRRRTSELSLADCFLLAAATGDDAIATADPAVAGAAREEAIELLGLPDSSGRRP